MIEEVGSEHRRNLVILFIDEAHDDDRARAGRPGQGDAANLPAAARAWRELRTIAATHLGRIQKKYFEKDAALARRLQVVKVEEPEESAAVEMMRGLVETLEQHHQVRILDEAVVDAAVVPSPFRRQLPDKSVSLLLDTWCKRGGDRARVRRCRRSRIGRRRIDSLMRPWISSAGRTVPEPTIAAVTDELNEEKTKAGDRTGGSWKPAGREEMGLVEKIREIRRQLRGGRSGQ